MKTEFSIGRPGNVGATAVVAGMLATSAMAGITPDFSANYNSGSLNADLGVSLTATANGTPAYMVAGAGGGLLTGALNASSAGAASVTYAGANLPMTGAGTIELWFNPNWNGNSAEMHYLFQSYAPQDWSQPTNLSLYVNNGTLGFVINYDHDYSYETAFTDVSHWVTGQWHHIAAAWYNCDGNGASTLNLYVDGALMSVGGGWETQVVLQTVTEVYVGNNRSAGYNANGFIDALNYYDARIYTGNSYAVPMAEQVPEPVGMGLLGFGALALLRRRT